MAVLKNINY